MEEISPRTASAEIVRHAPSDARAVLNYFRSFPKKIKKIIEFFSKRLYKTNFLWYNY